MDDVALAIGVVGVIVSFIAVAQQRPGFAGTGPRRWRRWLRWVRRG